jgi:hypothetical protein
MATVRPPKRRRTGHRLPPIVEGSDMSLDTAMYIQSEGGERILVPVRPDTPAQTNMETEPEPALDHEYQQSDIDMNHEEYLPPQRKNRWFYMKEFVARVGGILQAIQAREALPESARCAECDASIAHWRCEECAERKLLCRVCMRHSHSSNPFHRIECWTGTHFRKAALWEVGVYLLLPHQNGGICPNLIPQSDDIPDHIDIPICPPSPSHMQFPVSDDETSNAMDVVLSDDIEMPMSVVSTDSGSDLNDIVFPGSPIMTGQSPYVPDVVAINRDPTTGRFTAASFANFPDELLD